jgi:outer membrane protein assembly factor BamB
MLPHLALLALAAADANWPAFRGPASNGVSETPAPTVFNADPESGPLKNIKWKTPIPGLGHSSPIVWQGRIFVASAVRKDGDAPLKVGLYGAGDSADDDVEQRWKVFALDKNTGKILWERTAHTGVPKARRHTKATHANTTVTTDGKRLIAFFGSEGLYAYDLDGKLLWKKDLGLLDFGPWDDQTLSWGFASSPVLFDDTVVVQCDRKGDPFVATFNAKDGREIWRTSRKGTAINGWATPAVVRTAKRTQVVLNAYPYIASYDFETGKELWRLKSLGDIPVPTPIFANGLIYVTNAHGGGAPLYAIKPDAEGDITPATNATTSSGVVWSEPRNGAYMQTPLLAGGLVYSCSDRGVLKVFDALTGKLHYQQRIGGGTTGFSASNVIAGSAVYQTSEEGEVYVFETGTAYKPIGMSRLGEITMASPAVSDGTLYFRTRRHLVAVH